MKCIVSALGAWVVGGVLAAGCGPAGVAGISGEVALDDNILLDQQNAKSIFVGAYSAEQLKADGWPTGNWKQAAFSAQITDLTNKPYKYALTNTESSVRYYLCAFLDQNGDGSDEPGIATVNTTAIADVVGRYKKNPVVPIDDTLKDIDIVLNVQVQ